MFQHNNFWTGWGRAGRVLLLGATLGALLVGAIGCGFDPVIEPRTVGWIDAPADGSIVAVGVPVQVSTTFELANRPPQSLTLHVKGPVDADLPMILSQQGENLIRGDIQWTPGEEGTYKLSVELCQRDDCTSTDSIKVKVQSISAHMALISPTPSPTAIPTSTPMPPTATFTLLPPTVTFTPSPLPPTATPLLPTSTPVPSPTPTSDTVRPQVWGVTASEEEIKWPECEPSSVRFTAHASDAGGVVRVTLLYRVVRGGTEGQWIDKTMPLQQGNLYAVTFTAEELEQSLDPPVNASSSAYMEYYITAEDQAGNLGQAPHGGQGYRLPIVLCTVPR